MNCRVEALDESKLIVAWFFEYCWAVLVRRGPDVEQCVWFLTVITVLVCRQRMEERDASISHLEELQLSYDRDSHAGLESWCCAVGHLLLLLLATPTSLESCLSRNVMVETAESSRST